jgi:hypothetical protein
VLQKSCALPSIILREKMTSPFGWAWRSIVERFIR